MQPLLSVHFIGMRLYTLESEAAFPW